MSKRAFQQRTLFGGPQPEEKFYQGDGLYQQVMNRYMNDHRHEGFARQDLQKRAKAYWTQLKGQARSSNLQASAPCPFTEYLSEAAELPQEQVKSQSGFFVKSTPTKCSSTKHKQAVVQHKEDKTHSPASSNAALCNKGTRFLCVSCSLMCLFLVSVFPGGGSSKVLFSGPMDEKASVEFRLFLAQLPDLAPSLIENGVAHYLANGAFASSVSAFLSRYLQNSSKTVAALHDSDYFLLKHIHN